MIREKNHTHTSDFKLDMMNYQMPFVLPPSFALYANPTPQFELLNTAAITPALFSPCLRNEKKCKQFMISS